MIAISMDDRETQHRFKTELKAPFSFVADPEGKVVNLYDVKTPVVSYAQRYTFVVGTDRKVLKVESGGDAIDPEGAIVACPIRRKSADGGTKPDGGH